MNPVKLATVTAAMFQRHERLIVYREMDELKVERLEVERLEDVRMWNG
jgi:hypothetical protein